MGRWLVTGTAGFVGFHVAQRLLDEGHEVLGIDNLEPYYSLQLKRRRLAQLEGRPGWRRVDLDIRDGEALRRAWGEFAPDTAVHLAAQPGVRYAHEAPLTYVTTNVVGFANVLECAGHEGVEHLAYASSSSVYGDFSRVPFSTHDSAAHPVSLYAATKRADELMAHSYSHLYGIPTTGLRFFTVYGPWGRPDMAYFLFTKALLERRPLTVFGDGSAVRDFTYIDDIVEGVVRVGARVPKPPMTWDRDVADPGSSPAPWKLFNIGCGGRHTVRELITTLEGLLGRRAQVQWGEPIAGDVQQTEAETDDLAQHIEFRPGISLAEGLERFCRWYCDARSTWATEIWPEDGPTKSQPSSRK